ncbi:MAG: T9SS type A sorting domain-containing protein [Ignavibacteria bacterium]
MLKLIFIISLFPVLSFGQSNSTTKDLVNSEISLTENRILKRNVIQNYFNGKSNLPPVVENNLNYSNLPNINSQIRWSYTDPVSIGYFCDMSRNGKYGITGWELNNERASLYDSNSSTPLWEYFTGPIVTSQFVAISDTGGIIGVSSERKIQIFNNTSNIPFYNFDLTTLPYIGYATFLDITNDGKFLVCSASYEDSSTVFGIDVISGNIVWSKRIRPEYPTNGAWIQGIKMSGNDSLVIVNNSTEFFVIKTFTGEVIFQGYINPSAPTNHTQSVQGISGDGRVVATISNFGLLRVYQWNGTTYDFIWQDQELTGFYGWYSSIDITYDGNYIAAGVLLFNSLEKYYGKIKLFETNQNGMPYWIYDGCGDFISGLSFSKSGNILSAVSWGAIDNSKEDLYVFKTFLGNTPIFKINTPGSLFTCKTSDDGQSVLASGKAVHARIFGLGGLLYNIRVDTSDIITSVNNESLVPNNYSLYQNYPNPFNPVTKIVYELPYSEFVLLKVFDILGKEIATLVNQKQDQGKYSVDFNAGNLPSGTYFYKIATEKYSQVRKMVLTK